MSDLEGPRNSHDHGRPDSGALGNLMNKEEWHDAVAIAVIGVHSESSPLSVLFIDINNFKDVNDDLGHGIGDKVIEEVQHLISGSTIGGGGGRIGGDEFGVLAFTNEEQMNIAAEELRETLKDYILSNPKLQELGVGFAIGASTLRPGMTNSELLREADQAMYKDKLSQLPELNRTQRVLFGIGRLAFRLAGVRQRDVGKYESVLRS